nr:hypothetical protein [Pandoravirus massiliensis]
MQEATRLDVLDTADCGTYPWTCTAPSLWLDHLPAELWDHVLGFVDDDRDLASLAGSCRLLWCLSARPRCRLARRRWDRARAFMDEAVDAWEVQTGIDWRPRFDLQECCMPRHDGDDASMWHHPLDAWICDRGIACTPSDPAVICGACAAKIDQSDPIAWPRCRIDIDAPHVGTWDTLLYKTYYWWRSHRLADDVDFVVPPALAEWADPEAAAALADRWRCPARYGLAADTDLRPLQGMLVLEGGLAPSRMGSVRGWLPVAWRRVRIAWAHSGRRLWGAQFVLVCCDRASPLWGAGVIVEQNATLAMGRWAIATDDLSSLVMSLPSSSSSSHPVNDATGPGAPFASVHGHNFKGDAAAACRPTKAARRDLVAQCWARMPRDTSNALPSSARLWSYVITLDVAVDDEPTAAPIETADDDDEGAFWHCSVISYAHNRGRRVYADLDQNGRRGLFW